MNRLFSHLSAFMNNESRAKTQSLPNPRSESKVLVGQKRETMEGEDTSESSHKRVKLGDVESVWPSKVPGGTGHNDVHQDVNSNPGALDLNGTVTVGIEESNTNLGSVKEQKNRGFDLDLNAEDISSSIDNDPFYPFKKYDHLKSRDDSECGSSVGPLDEKDSMTAWEGLKRNNYMTTHGALPMPITKNRGKKKSSDDLMKNKIELAKKEQVDRFAKIAVPSGLLNGLNPGIINHVRNSKQVHSIIEALVRSERTQKEHSGSNRIKNAEAEIREERINLNRSGLFAKCSYLISEVKRADGDSYKSDELALKLSSSVSVASGNTSCLSNEESGNITSVTSLSVKAANVASQWLELLNQDIRGRLAALRRSKKRVRAVITTELPLLISKEFASNLQIESCMTKASGDAHAVRWSNLFGQMDKALSEEESHLESWLNQVKEMQLQCEKGFYSTTCNASQEMGPAGNQLGEADNSDKDLAVRAAAASIYSTCNFLSAMENLPCC